MMAYAFCARVGADRHRTGALQVLDGGVEVAEVEREGKTQISKIDYTLAGSLDDISAFSFRNVSILTNANDDNTHRIVINGAMADALTFNLAEGQVSGAIQTAREQLMQLHIGNGRNLYDENNAKSADQFVKDLTELAYDGWLLWQALFQGETLEQRIYLRKELFKEPGTIQIARTLGISHRTVEVHRARVMQKTGVTNLVELSRLAQACGLLTPP